MKFMMMMNAPRNGYAHMGTWEHKDLVGHITYMKTFAKKLKASGELVLAEGLSTPEQAKLITSDASGRPVIDGVFPESKEYLAGFWIVNVPTAERAYELAAEAAMAPGKDGKPLHLKIEVREVPAGPPPDWEA